jgi:hypothetical protein
MEALLHFQQDASPMEVLLHLEQGACLMEVLPHLEQSGGELSLVVAATLG